MKALIADDDLPSRTVLRRMLTRNGWSVDEVSDGEGAVEACSSIAYNLVMLDIRMTGLSGHEAARSIARNHGENGNAPKKRPYLVAVTGADKKNTDDFVDFDAYLQKPFILSELQTCLEGLLSCGNRGSNDFLL